MDNRILMRHNGLWAAKPDTLVNTWVEKGGGVPSGEPGTGKSRLFVDRGSPNGSQAHEETLRPTSDQRNAN